jgi:hypothetical protein
VNAAVQILNSAIIDFKNKRQKGTKLSGFTQAELTELITTANDAKNGIKTSTDGSDVSNTEYWVTYDVLNALNSAITTAQNASGNFDTAYTALNTAITTFNNAKARGTQQVSQYITITTFGEYFEYINQLGYYGSFTIPSSGTTLNAFYQELQGYTYEEYYEEYLEYIKELGYEEIIGNAFFYKDQACTQPFNGNDRIYANTKFYMKSGPLQVPVRTKIGEITGTITLTDVPNPAPNVQITAQLPNGDDYYGYYGSARITFSGSGTVTNIHWAIPIYEYESGNINNFTSSTVQFSLSIRSGGLIGTSIPIPTTKTINSLNANVGSLGTVSIKTITLSGTINVTNNGQPVPPKTIFQIQAVGKDELGNLRSYGALGALPTSLTANAPWSITIPAFSSSTQVSFLVSGSSLDGGFYFSGELSSPTVNVYNTNVSGISLNLNITTITLSGTINVTYNGQPVPEVYIRAYSESGGFSEKSTRLTSPGTNAPWSITLETFDSSTQVSFEVYGYSSNGEYFSKSVTLSPPVYVSNQNVSGITLNLGDITN